MTHAEHPPSYYTATANATERRPRLRGETRCDICVVGAGFTGLAAALALAERGYEVVVIEARRVGWGASGRSGGQLISGYAPGMAATARLVGRARARAMWDLAEEAKALVRDRIARHGIRCDIRRGYLLAAVKKRHLSELREERDLVAGEWDYPHYRLLDRDGTRAAVASERFLGGLVDGDGGHLHPLNYALGLADAAAGAGVRIFEETPAVRLATGPAPVVDTPEGVVRARHVVLACNAYVDEIVPRLRRLIMPVGTYIMATEPLGEARALALIPGDLAVCDTNFVLDYFRLTADRRMLFGGLVSYTERDPRDLEGAMRRRMLRTFPQLADCRADYVWGGYVAITRNRLPAFGRLDGSLFYAHGFSGQGVALTTLAGALIAEAVAGQAERFDVFAGLRHRDFPGGRALRAPLLVLATLYSRLRDLL